MSKYYNITAISSEPIKLEEIGRREGVSVYNIEMVRAISLFVDICCLFKFSGNQIITLQ